MTPPQGDPALEALAAALLEASGVTDDWPDWDREYAATLDRAAQTLDAIAAAGYRLVPAAPAAEEWDYNAPHPFESADLGNPTYGFCACGRPRENAMHFTPAPAAGLREALEGIVHIHHGDPDTYARAYNQGYDDALELVNDPAAAPPPAAPLDVDLLQTVAESMGIVASQHVNRRLVWERVAAEYARIAAAYQREEGA